MAATLHIATWLAPGIPLSFFETCASHLERALRRPCELHSEARHSGPMTSHDDRFADGRVDIGFVCAPSYLWLREREQPSVALVPAAPVPGDQRAADRPVYFAEVIVRNGDTPAPQRFEQLAGQRFVYNDPSSLSGYFCLWKRVVDAGWDDSFFGSLTCSGSHKSSLDAVIDGAADAAAIDANVLARWRSEHPERARRVRSLETLGPFPIQPVVVRAGLGALRDTIAETLLRIPETLLAPAGIRRFDAIDPMRYDDDLDLMQLPERLPSGVRWLDRY